MKVPNVMMLDFKDVGNILGGEEQELVAAYLGVEGDITGSILFLIHKDTAMMCNILHFAGKFHMIIFLVKSPICFAIDENPKYISIAKNGNLEIAVFELFICQELSL
jgi:hypothetical protein